MAGSKTKYGIIAEDNSDFLTIVEFVRKINTGTSYTFKKAVGRGGGRIKSKSTRYAKTLATKGCNRLIIARDCDDNDPAALRKEMEKANDHNPIKDRVIVIPVRTIESWLLCDIDALTAFYGSPTRKLREFHNPESIEKPKVTIADVVKKNYSKIYLSTKHNAQIARLVNIHALSKCRSFDPLKDFVCA